MDAKVNRRYFAVKSRIVQGWQDLWPGPDASAKRFFELRHIAAFEYVTDVELNCSFGVFEINCQESLKVACDIGLGWSVLWSQYTSRTNTASTELIPYDVSRLIPIVAPPLAMLVVNVFNWVTYSALASASAVIVETSIFRSIAARICPPKRPAMAIRTFCHSVEVSSTGENTLPYSSHRPSVVAKLLAKP